LSPLTFTLLSDGSSDRALRPVLQWLLRQSSGQDFQGEWADLRRMSRPPRSLSERLRAAQALYPCDLLFVHRDSEKESREDRVEEIRRHLENVPGQTAVCVVPVRMQEAWFLFDENAIRLAADNPRGKMALNLPALTNVEGLADPKGLLCSALSTASGLRAGRLNRFRPEARIHRLSEVIEDFSPLRRLSAFQALEEELRTVLAAHSWL
jgi:hypothetical protein